MTTTHPRPRGVTVTTPDGKRTPCELAYVGTDPTGMTTWAALTPAGPDCTVTVDYMPGATTITFPTPPCEDPHP